MEDNTQEFDTGAFARANMHEDLTRALHAIHQLRTSEALLTVYQQTRMLLVNRLRAEQEQARATRPELLSDVLALSIERLATTLEGR